MTAMSRLVLENVSKHYRGAAVLDGVSLTVESGETVVVCGPSGSGKTVLLRLIAGTVAPEAGDIRIDGASILGRGAEERDVGMAFQNFALYPHMSAFENIASPLRARRLAESEIKAKVDQIAQLLRISHVLGHRPRELSNGQKQRTALGRALVRGPGVLLLDDPLRNVDAKLRYEMRLELPRLLTAFGSAVIYVTQDYREAMALGRRIAVLRNGKFEQIAAPPTVYSQPANLEIARLFGDPTINLFPCRPQAGGLELFGQTAAVAGRTRRTGRARRHGGHPRRGYRDRAGAGARRRSGRARRRDPAQRARRALSAQPGRQGAAGDRGRGRRAALRPRPSPGLGAAGAGAVPGLRFHERRPARAGGGLRRNSWPAWCSTMSARSIAAAARRR